MTFWEDKKVLVTGGHGFLGSHLVPKLLEKNCRKVITPTHSECDLTEAGKVGALYSEVEPDIVIHLAAVVGGIGANQASPATFFYKNMLMGMNVIHKGRVHEVKKIVVIGTVCSYPKITSVPFREESLWNGYPEETNAPYGIAKKALLVMGQTYRKQYGLNVIHVIPTNLYGPKDDFDPQTSHVIPALIRKIVEAKKKDIKKIDVWGTGKPTREFLYVEDAAEGIIQATEFYNELEPVNLGSGFEVNIKSLVALIADIVGFKGETMYDITKPDGQPRRYVSTYRANSKFGFRAKTSLPTGLRKTVEWYLKEGKNEMSSMQK